MPPKAELRRLVRLARLMDASFSIPGTRFRFGLDALIGLIPGVGDIAMTLFSLWIVYRGRRLGASARTTWRMLWNVALDLIGGAVPVVGDLFDAAWKANQRNVALLLEELKE